MGLRLTCKSLRFAYIKFKKYESIGFHTFTDLFLKNNRFELHTYFTFDDLEAFLVYSSQRLIAEA
jgi:hypothetical protein